MAKRKIIWAFNPYQKNPRLLKNVVTLLQALVKTSGFAVEPVYVVSPAETNVLLEFSISAKQRFRTAATRECQKVLKKIRIPHLLPLKILVENQLRLSSSAKNLARYGKSSGAAAIVVGTHGREGLSRVLLGSFAETLLFQTKTPMFLVNPHLKWKGPLTRVLFASDFSPASRPAFAEFCRLAAALHSSILLYHVLPTPFPWASSATEFLWGGEAVSVGEYIRQLTQIREKEADYFFKVAKRHKLSLNLSIEPSGTDVGSSILQMAKQEKVQAIALSAQSGRLETAILGAASRHVIREAEIPVWVQRTGG